MGFYRLQGLKQVLVFQIRPVLLAAEVDNSFRFTDQSEDAVGWNWTFSNGYTSSKQNPTIILEQAGEI